MIAPVDKSRQASGRDGEARGLDCEAIARAADLERSRVECVAEIGSTNLELMNRPMAPDALTPLVLIAGRQSAGRGRRGRTWLGGTPHGLAMSICIHRARRGAHAPLTGLPLALGAAIATTVAPYARGIGLKWPNDLLRDGRKCAGMLVETRTVGEMERVVVGLGLNWQMPPALARSLAGVAGDVPVARDLAAQPTAPPAGGLFDALPEPVLRERITGELAAAIIACTRRFFELGFADTAVRWARFDALAGREVAIVLDAQRVLSGRAEGLDRHGALRVRTADGIVPVAAGDVSARFLGDGQPAGARQ